MKTCAQIIVLLLFFPLSAMAADIRYGAELSEQFVVERNYFSFDEPVGFHYDDASNLLVFSPFLSISSGTSIHGYLLGDLFWYRSFETDENDIDTDLANAFVSVRKNRFTASVGIQPVTFGRGFLFDSNEPAVAMEMDLGRERYVGITAAQVIDASEMASISFGIVPGLFEKIELFAVVFRDKDDAIAGVLNHYLDILIEDEPETVYLDSSKGDLYWIGGGADLFVGDVYVTTTLIAQGGDITLTSESEELERSYSVPSLLFDVEAQYNLTPSLAAGAFLFTMTGEQPDREGDLTVFIPPLPINTRTSIFLNEKFGFEGSIDMVSARGIAMAGVVSPGVTFDWLPVPRVSLQLISALLYPFDTPDSGRNFYGWETDLSMSWELTDHQKLYLETGLFLHGNYYSDASGGSPPSAVRIMAGYNLWF